MTNRAIPDTDDRHPGRLCFEALNATAAITAAEKANGEYDDLGILMTLEVEHVKRTMESQPSFVLPPSTAGEQLELEAEEYSNLLSDEWIKHGPVNFTLQKAADFMTRRKRPSLALDACAGQPDIARMRAHCKANWSPGYLNEVHAVFWPWFRKDHWMLLIAEPKNKILRVYNGLREKFETSASHAVQTFTKLAEEFGGVQLETRYEDDVFQGDNASSGAIALIHAALFALDDKKFGRQQLDEEEALGLRWWIAYKLCYPGALDETSLSRLAVFGSELKPAAI